MELTEHGGWRVSVHPDMAAVWAAHREAELLLVDMPIGLTDAAEGRRCDRLARAMLKPGRASSVFPAPARCVLGASGYAEANALQRERTGRGLSRQSWNLTGKIRELDALLQREGVAVRERLRESHPELCLAILFGEPMAHGKKTADGYRERVTHLSGVFPAAGALVESALAVHRRSELARDDVVDALALAVSALLSGGRLQRVPEAEERDGTGLLCAVWFYDRLGRISRL
ncbi:DUF429 domain-containing protein [Paenibacillus filicis]|uniref:DUF429 domain-containing protein n=1 Tax=Paenibacillus gyeongsangnamensis TaxID=3388067 RepID=A0ABT4QDE2_9BACL|nr:DUF429 domain-containing protein [Paenibacillus filicis]MCZ8514705.1 DUF429 domain-containing protein [Paenibacillus filicis]